MSATEKKVAAGSLGNLEENLRKVTEASNDLELNPSKRTKYSTLKMWVDLANDAMQAAIASYQQIKVNGKVTADDIKLTDETIDKFTKEYEMVLTRANDLYDLMEENMVKKPAGPGNREAGAEQPPAVGDNPTSVLVIQPSFKPLQNLCKETTPIEAEGFFDSLK